MTLEPFQNTIDLNDRKRHSAQTIFRGLAAVVVRFWILPLIESNLAEEYLPRYLNALTLNDHPKGRSSGNFGFLILV